MDRRSQTQGRLLFSGSFTCIELQERLHEKVKRTKEEDFNRTEELESAGWVVLNNYIDDKKFSLDAFIKHVKEELEYGEDPITYEKLKERYSVLADDEEFAEEYGIPLIDGETTDDKFPFELKKSLKPMGISKTKNQEIEGWFHWEEEDDEEIDTIEDNDDEDSWEEMIEAKAKDVDKGKDEKQITYVYGKHFIEKDGKIFVNKETLSSIALRAETVLGQIIHDKLWEFFNYIMKYALERSERLKEKRKLINKKRLADVLNSKEDSKYKIKCQDFRMRAEKSEVRVTELEGENKD